MPIVLSICIPTFNRSKYLSESLDTILVAAEGFEREIEIVISDNASVDDTSDVVQAYQDKHPWISYHRNEENIGAERNFYLLATLAKGQNIWIFGDDDQVEKDAVFRILESIHSGNALTICNYSLWDKQLVLRRKTDGLPGQRDRIFNSPNELLRHFGAHLGYSSSIIIKKGLFLEVDTSIYEKLTEYGFSLLYAIYAGVADGSCKAKFIASPLVRNRGGNSEGFDWSKYFVEGVARVFNNLPAKGYAKSAVRSAKHKQLRDVIIRRILYLKAGGSGNGISLCLIFHYYNENWLFWTACIPAYFIPSTLVRNARKIFLSMRPTWQASDL